MSSGLTHSSNQNTNLRYISFLQMTRNALKINDWLMRDSPQKPLE